MGGTQKTAQLFVEHLPRSRYCVHAAGWRGGGRLHRVQQVAAETFINPNPIAMMEWIKSRKIDIVHFHRMGVTDTTLIKTFVNADVPILVEHNIFGRFDNSSDRSKITRQIFLSRVQLELYRHQAGTSFDTSKCLSMYMPVECGEWNAYPWNRDPGAPSFGRHSRPAAAKWHPINVACLPLIRAQIPEAQFHVIGLPDEYRAKIEAVGCMGMVRESPTTLSTTQLCDFLNGINVFTHGSSLGESFGMVIAEAMISGLPVVTHLGGDRSQSELISDCFNGFVTSAEDAEGYARRVVELLRNPQQAALFGARGNARAKQWFHVEKIISQLDHLFSELYAQHKASHIL